MEPLTVRDGDEADVAAVREVFRRSSWSNEGDRELLRAHPEFLEWDDTFAKHGRLRVALVGATIVGFATTTERADALELEDLFVDPAWKRHGIARTLVTDAAAFARDRGLARIEVTANDHALPFYERVGFVQVGRAAVVSGSAPRMHLAVKSEPNG